MYALHRRIVKLESRMPKVKLIPIARFNFDTQQIETADHPVIDSRGIITASYQQLYEHAKRRCEELYAIPTVDRRIEDFED